MGIVCPDSARSAGMAKCKRLPNCSLYARRRSSATISQDIVTSQSGAIASIWTFSGFTVHIQHKVFAPFVFCSHYDSAAQTSLCTSSSIMLKFGQIYTLISFTHAYTTNTFIRQSARTVPTAQSPSRQHAPLESSKHRGARTRHPCILAPYRSPCESPATVCSMPQQ